jgi:hypothetical protein
MELLVGLEPTTSSLPRKCSTTELQQRGSVSPSRIVARLTSRGEVTSAREDSCPRGSGGAGDGNRTHVCSLEGCRSTIELRPRSGPEIGPRIPRRGSGQNLAESDRREQDGQGATEGTRDATWWWGEADSNRRRLSHQIYSLARLAAPESPLRRAPVGRDARVLGVGSGPRVQAPVRSAVGTRPGRDGPAP